MNDNWWESLLAWLLMPATLFGAGGAMIHAVRKGKSPRQTVAEGVSGIIIAHMIYPIITAHTPEIWHYSLYFLTGWGGLELVNRVYEAAVSALEERIRGRVSGREDGPEGRGPDGNG